MKGIHKHYLKARRLLKQFDRQYHRLERNPTKENYSELYSTYCRLLGTSLPQEELDALYHYAQRAHSLVKKKISKTSAARAIPIVVAILVILSIIFFKPGVTGLHGLNIPFSN